MGNFVIGGTTRYSETMALPERLTIDPEILSGKPVIRGSRISAELVLDLLAHGMSEAEILDNYPGLQHEDILACLTYATQLAREWKAYPYLLEQCDWSSTKIFANRQYGRSGMPGMTSFGFGHLYPRQK